MTLQELILQALKEDIPAGDLTTDPLNLHSKTGRAKLVAKQDLILSGEAPFQLSFQLIHQMFGQMANGDVTIRWNYRDGQKVANGSTICELEGPLDILLKGERTALNFLGHLSGIATVAHQYAARTLGTKAKILDTRKTTPGLRELEKKAVKDGGGTNHRLNLSTGILIKENHIRAAGGIRSAVEKLRLAHGALAIEVEVTNRQEIEEALAAGADQLLLDNMNVKEIAESVALVNGRATLEASGNMSLDRIESVAKTGVDFISVGRLTHSAPAADMSLLFAKL